MCKLNELTCKRRHAGLNEFPLGLHAAKQVVRSALPPRGLWGWGGGGGGWLPLLILYTYKFKLLHGLTKA